MKSETALLCIVLALPVLAARPSVFYTAEKDHCRISQIDAKETVSCRQYNNSGSLPNSLSSDAKWIYAVQMGSDNLHEIVRYSRTEDKWQMIVRAGSADSTLHDVAVVGKTMWYWSYTHGYPGDEVIHGLNLETMKEIGHIRHAPSFRPAWAPIDADNVMVYSDGSWLCSISMSIFEECKAMTIRSVNGSEITTKLSAMATSPKSGITTLAWRNGQSTKVTYALGRVDVNVAEWRATGDEWELNGEGMIGDVLVAGWDSIEQRLWARSVGGKSDKIIVGYKGDRSLHNVALPSGTGVIYAMTSNDYQL